MVEIYFDGAVAPFNPGGHGGYGLLVVDESGVLFSEAVYIGRWPELSNNVSEYCGAIAALRYVLRKGITEATVYGDANIVINQLNGKWAARNGAYVPYYHEAASLRRQVPNVKFQWIPREMNGPADELSKQAVTQHPRVVGFKLDPGIQPFAFKVKKKRKRTRDVIDNRQFAEVAEDEAWNTFMLRYGPES